ncbi:MAG: hypothetical protein ACLFUH_11380 [Bacteroidales bacterium]
MASPKHPFLHFRLYKKTTPAFVSVLFHTPADAVEWFNKYCKKYDSPNEYIVIQYYHTNFSNKCDLDYLLSFDEIPETISEIV